MVLTLEMARCDELNVSFAASQAPANFSMLSSLRIAIIPLAKNQIEVLSLLKILMTYCRRTWIKRQRLLFLILSTFVNGHNPLSLGHNSMSIFVVRSHNRPKKQKSVFFTVRKNRANAFRSMPVRSGSRFILPHTKTVCDIEPS